MKMQTEKIQRTMRITLLTDSSKLKPEPYDNPKHISGFNQGLMMTKIDRIIHDSLKESTNNFLKFYCAYF